jgi:tetratricopeptide (TPR) repeat protein
MKKIKMTRFVKMSTAAAVVCIMGGVAVVAQNAGGSMNKPLARFTMGDLFPNSSAGLRETASSWKVASDNARALASSELKNVRESKPPVKAELESARKDAKAAEKSKDFEAAGAAQGRVKSGEMVLDVLNRLEGLASTHNDLAEAWAKAGEKMRAFAEADDAFDRYRSSGIAKPDSNQKDTRLDKAGLDAFKNRAQALRELGEAFDQIGAKTRNFGDGQLKLADDLQKSGHTQTPGK